jgi:hypothetical protein
MGGSGCRFAADETACDSVSMARDAQVCGENSEEQRQLVNRGRAVGGVWRCMNMRGLQSIVQAESREQRCESVAVVGAGVFWCRHTSISSSLAASAASSPPRGGG